MKNFISVILTIIFTIGSLMCVRAYENKAIYAPDGRVAYVSSNEVAIYCNLGWYSYPVVTIYAPDGRSAVIKKNELRAYQNVGWYDYPVTTVYAPDGRTLNISVDELHLWKAVGWYEARELFYGRNFKWIRAYFGTLTNVRGYEGAYLYQAPGKNLWFAFSVENTFSSPCAYISADIGILFPDLKLKALNGILSYSDMNSYFKQTGEKIYLQMYGEYVTEYKVYNSRSGSYDIISIYTDANGNYNVNGILVDVAYRY